jgi:hypothetical protein
LAAFTFSGKTVPIEPYSGGATSRLNRHPAPPAGALISAPRPIRRVWKEDNTIRVEPRHSAIRKIGQKKGILGIVAIGLGIAGILMPYLAAVFLVPVALICGFIAIVRGQKANGAIGCFLGVIGLIGIIYVSQQISGILGNPSESAPSLPVNSLFSPPILTKEKYDQIEHGISYAEANSIIGQNGIEVGWSDTAGYTTVIYSWTNSNGSHMTATFQNGCLVSKAQFGLPCCHD